MENTHEAFMRRAIELSRIGMDSNAGGPFGAVIVKDGKIIGEGHNLVTSTNDPTAHGEVVAIRNACKQAETFDLEGSTIYTSCEPCPMCLSAIYWARISHIYYANTAADAAAIDFDDALIYQQVALPRKERIIPASQLLRDEALSVFTSWKKKQDRTPY